MDWLVRNIRCFLLNAIHIWIFFNSSIFFSFFFSIGHCLLFMLFRADYNKPGPYKLSLLYRQLCFMFSLLIIFIRSSVVFIHNTWLLSTIHIYTFSYIYVYRICMYNLRFKSKTCHILLLANYEYIVFRVCEISIFHTLSLEGKFSVSIRLI